MVPLRPRPGARWLDRLFDPAACATFPSLRFRIGSHSLHIYAYRVGGVRSQVVSTERCNRRFIMAVVC